MAGEPAEKMERRFPRARRGFWIGFGLGALNFVLNPFVLVLALSSPRAAFSILLFALLVGALGAGLGALFDLGARGVVRKRTVLLMVLFLYVLGYLGARYSRTLVHTTTHARRVVSHGVSLGDPGIFNAFPLVRASLLLVFLPASMAESMAWTLFDPVPAEERIKAMGQRYD